MSDSKDKFILHKDLEKAQYTLQNYVLRKAGVSPDCSTNIRNEASPSVKDDFFGGVIYLTTPDYSANIISVASLSLKDNIIKIGLNLVANNLYDFQKSEIPKNSKKGLHLQGNTIVFLIKVKSQRNFYRFEFDARGNQTLYYFHRFKNMKYKLQKINKECIFTQEYAPDHAIWGITISIPFAHIGLLPQDINGSNFLIARYIYSQSSVRPVVVDSMAIGEEQFKNPEAWNMFSFDDPDKEETNKQFAEDCLKHILEIKNQKYAIEYIEKNIDEKHLAELYTALLHRIYVGFNKIEYDEMFRTLERFVNIPEFVDGKKLQKLTAMFVGIVNEKTYNIMYLIQLIMDGTAFLKAKDAQDEIKAKDQQKATYFQKGDKNQAQEKREDENKILEPCFWEIWRRESNNEKFGKIEAKRYFAENCPCLKKMMKFSTFRLRYDDWFKSFPKESEEFKNPPSKTCFNKNNWCKALPPSQDIKILEPCFLKILHCEIKGKKFGEKEPPRYFHDKCPYLNNLKSLKFDEFKSKYDKWHKYISKYRPKEFKNPPSKTCSQNLSSCKDFLAS